MIPDIAPRMKSPGEAELFERFRVEPGTEDWIVLHSLDLSDHVERISGEADFVVIVPARGVLVVEVKAVHSIHRENGVWFLGQADKPDARGPFKQAAEAMHSLREAVARSDPTLRRVVFWSAVIFPYIDFPFTSPEWHEWQVVDKTALRSGLAEALLRVLDHARELISRTRALAWFDASHVHPTARESLLLARALRGDFEVWERPRSRLRRLHEEVVRYTEEQYLALDAMADNPRVIFDGAAGTGKTMLAIEAARRASARNKRVLLLCFNRALGRWLTEQATDLVGVTSATLHSHMLAVASIPPTGEASFWTTALPTAATDIALARDGGDYDVVLLDEAQDMLIRRYFDYFDVALSGGLRAGSWWMFGDFTNQRIYDHDVDEPDRLLAEYSALAPRFRLKENCRNTPRVATYAGMLGGVPGSYVRVRRPDNGINPETKFYSSTDDQVRLLTEAIRDAERQGYSGESIAILSARGDGACVHKLAREWSSRVGDVDANSSGRMRCSTIHAFKGLEAPVVILTDIEEFGPRTKDLFYTGATRSLDRVIVLAHDRVRGELARALLDGGQRNDAA